MKSQWCLPVSYSYSLLLASCQYINANSYVLTDVE